MVNWGLANQGGFQNALAQGLQMGNMIRERREEKEYKNALEAVFSGGQQQGQTPPIAGADGMGGNREAASADPRQAAMGVIAQRNPQLADRLMQREAEQRQQAQLSDLTQRAMQGDPQAKQQLLGVSYERWSQLDKAEQERMAAQQKQHGNAALYALQAGDPASRRQIVTAYAQKTGDPEVAALAQLPDDQLEAALRNEVFEAEMADDLIRMEQPDYMAIPEGGTLVDTRNPQAVSQFGQGATVQEGATATNPQTGEKIIFRGGQWAPMGGGASNGAGGFPSGQ